MPLARIIKPGIQTTVQDLGRTGYRHLGIPLAGAVDPWALIAANNLVGNRPVAACLEMALTGPELYILSDCVIAVTGADLGPRLLGKPLPMWESVYCRSGSTLSFGYRRSGFRSYLAVAGGIDVPEVLGSRSTFLAGRFGGFEGRKMIKGDLLRAFYPDEVSVGVKFREDVRPVYMDEVSVRVIKGINSVLFSKNEYTKFFATFYRVSERTDRMGCCLDGETRIMPGGEATGESYPVVPGTVQILPTGQPIIMLNDAQSTGGYPQIATVVSADLWQIGQAVPGTKITFRETETDSAHRLLTDMNSLVQSTSRPHKLKVFKKTKTNYIVADVEYK